MRPEIWQRVEAVFEAALQRPPNERTAFLDSACKDNASLRSQVETLLSALDQNSSSISSEPSSSETLVDSASVIGKRLGSYRIVQEIGRGGMGSVYLAVRADDEFQKRVAIKLIKRGMDTDFIVRRFRNERQILASLDHPNVARLLDGGTTENGLPYFVMEYVEGQPIFQYCDTRKLTVTARLELFRKVCSAVNYAHQNKIIHRDLKPSNIQVTAQGVPKLLDFGIAKLLNPDLASETLAPTTAAMRLMTPEYASPEQIRGEIVTIASDVYSLGVLLYELLAEHRPYRPKTQSSHELARVICEDEPDLPSVAVNLIEVIPAGAGAPIEITPESVASARSTTPEQLRRELAGSLDNIISKTMRKKPRDRYESVEELSRDLRRFLEGDPVSAPSYFPSPIRSQVDTGEAVTKSKSLAVLPFQVLRSEEKSDEFLGMGMTDAIITKLSNLQRIMVRPTSAVIKYFDGAHNVLAAGHDLNVGYVLDGRIQRAGDRLRLTIQLIRVDDGVPLWAAKFDENYTDIFSVEDSVSEQVAQALIPRLSGEERELLLKHETDNAAAYQAYLKGRFFWNKFNDDGFDKALVQFREASRLDPDYALPYVGMADYYNWAAIYSIGSPGEYFPQAKAAAIKALQLDDSVAEAHAALAFTTLLCDWDWTGAETGFQRALELNPNYGPAHQWYSNLLAAQGRFSEAIREIKLAQEINPLSVMDACIGGWTYYHARQYESALAEVKRALEMDREFGNSYLVLGVVYEQLGQHEEAIEMLRKALELMPGSMLPLWALGYSLARANQRGEAEEVANRLKRLSEQHYISPYYRAIVYVGLGDREAAFQCLEKAFAVRDEWLIWLGTEPKLDALRSDKRFVEMLGRIGLKGDETKKAISYSESQISRAVHGSLKKRPTPTEKTDSFRLTPTDTLSTLTQRGGKKYVRLLWAIPIVAMFVAASFVGYRVLRRPATHFAATKLDKLTATGNIVSAAISQDGKYAAYVMDEGGRQGLWVRQMAVANSIRVVPPADSDYRGITFSNDGTYIYYTVSGKTGHAGVLCQIPALGGSVKEVKQSVDSAITFAPDGKQFTFIRSNSAAGEDALMISDASGASERQLASRKFPEHFSVSSAPAWSPDGTTVVSITQTLDNNGFYVKLSEFHVADGSEKQLGDKRWLEIGQLAWISDGSGLVMTAQDESSAFLNIWHLSYPGGEWRRITNDLSDYRSVSLPTGADSLLAVQRQTITSIFIAAKGDLNSPKQISSGAGRFFDLSWTPDGRLIYASDASGAADIWEMGADGTGQKQLTAGAGRNYAPVISPDGRRVFFHSNRSGSWQIWRMDRDGSNPLQVTADREESNWPEVSPDDQWLVYQHNTAGTPTVWKLPTAGGAPTQVNSALSMRPAVSPDGKLIAFWQKDATPNSPWRIAITPLSGGPAFKLLDVPQSPATANSVIHWTEDGGGILFIDFRNGVTNLMLQRLDGSPVKQLTNFSKEQFYSFDFSRDGRMALSRGFWTNDAVLISDIK